ncbi:MAG TPA: hypothetical protein VMV86_04475 [Methanosarcinales archaeon]|nr:hypothetical protein [Methanosarcinales archaeon]
MNKNEIWTNIKSKLEVKIFKIDKRHVWISDATATQLNKSKGEWQFKVAVAIEEFPQRFKRS